MPVERFRHVALTESLAASINGQVVKGKYTSASDLIRTAVRVLRSQERGKKPGRHSMTARLSQGGRGA